MLGFFKKKEDILWVSSSENSLHFICDDIKLIIPFDETLCTADLIEPALNFATEKFEYEFADAATKEERTNGIKIKTKSGHRTIKHEIIKMLNFFTDYYDVYLTDEYIIIESGNVQLIVLLN